MVRELGMSMMDVSRKMEISIAGVSLSVKRGEKIVKEEAFNLIDE
jgi:uncharacterized protein YlxP (DUF503 family)